MQKQVVITGVSTGIGYACAQHLLAKGFKVWGSVRTQADADRVKRELGSHFEPLVMDVTDTEAVKDAARLVADALGGSGLAGLVNNAGIAVSGPLMYLDMADLQHQMEVNVFGLMQVTQAFLPLLGAVPQCPHAPGRVVNISSVSGRVATPFMGAYAASKFAVEALTDALRRELYPFGVDVVSVQPGPVKTPIWAKAMEDEGKFAHTPYAPVLDNMARHIQKVEAGAVPAEAVAKVVHDALTARRPRTRRIVHAQPLAIRLVGLLPDRWVDRMMVARMKLVEMGNLGGGE